MALYFSLNAEQDLILPLGVLEAFNLKYHMNATNEGITSEIIALT